MFFKFSKVGKCYFYNPKQQRFWTLLNEQIHYEILLSKKKKVSWILCKEKFVHLGGKEVIMPCVLYCAQKEWQGQLHPVF